jgi:hypothetical protein
MKHSKKKKRQARDPLYRIYDKRDRALERVVKAYLKGEDADEDELDKALDVLTVAHAAAAFEFMSCSFTS